MEFNEVLFLKLKNGHEKSEELDNEYYSNMFNIMLFHYYYVNNDSQSGFLIFKKEISKKEIESKISYVRLLDEFCNMFNSISNDYYKNKILERI